MAQAELSRVIGRSLVKSSLPITEGSGMATHAHTHGSVGPTDVRARAEKRCQMDEARHRIAAGWRGSTELTNSAGAAKKAWRFQVVQAVWQLALQSSSRLYGGISSLCE